jgi:ubiquinone/menaquinone biosynthesis C-methylase UbiE
MPEERMPLAKAFALRPERFRMLEKGIKSAGWEGKSLSLLEIGCSKGDAAAFLIGENDYQITAIDISQELIDQALEEHSLAMGSGKLKFLCADATTLPFGEESCDGIYSEAAFSAIPDKGKVTEEFYRAIKPGGRVLINDFALGRGTGKDLRDEVMHIPCFAGVQTIETYIGLFEKAGFKTILCREDYGELIRVSSWLCKIYGVGVRQIGGYLSCYFRMGNPDAGDCNGKNSKGMFFKRAKLTYCQMIFEKSND